jgi:hypothetical protein
VTGRRLAVCCPVLADFVEKVGACAG